MTQSFNPHIHCIHCVIPTTDSWYSCSWRSRTEKSAYGCCNLKVFAYWRQIVRMRRANPKWQQHRPDFRSPSPARPHLAPTSAQLGSKTAQPVGSNGWPNPKSSQCPLSLVFFPCFSAIDVSHAVSPLGLNWCEAVAKGFQVAPLWT